MEYLCRPEFWTTFFTLALLEIVLGIDNIVFHSLTLSNLSREHQKRAAVLGLSLAMLFRFLLLWSLVWFMSLTKILVVMFGNEISARDVVLLGGGGFLVIKSALELCKPISEAKPNRKEVPKQISLKSCIIQIVILDLVFSIDSVITAVGMASDLKVIMMAILFSIVVMMLFSDRISNFLERHQKLRSLAFAFIALVGMVLVAEGFGVTVSKAYIYLIAGVTLILELIRERLCASQGEKRTTARVSRIKHKFMDAAETISHAYVPVGAPGPRLRLSCAQCDSESKGYSFCVQCGEGLGSVSLPLGEVNYACLQI
jgi:predicted tellurium resistance membrane protein TerC